MKEFSGKVFLECVRTQGNQNVTWWKDGNAVGHEVQLHLSSVYDDPRGLYVCETGGKKNSLQVHYRSKCWPPALQSHNCREFSPRGVSPALGVSPPTALQPRLVPCPVPLALHWACATALGHSANPAGPCWPGRAG